MLGRAGASIIWEWACIGSIITVAFFFNWWLSYLLAIVLIGALQHRVAVLGHEAAHWALLGRNRANDVIGDVCCFAPLFASLQNYRHWHLCHHANTNDAQSDPDIQWLGSNLPDKGHPPGILGMVEWWVRHPVRFLRYQYAYILLTFVGVHAGARRGHWGNRICIWGLAIVILTVMGPRAWAHFLLLWITPLATILPLFLSVRDVYQHHPAADLTRTYRGDAFTRWACFPYGQAFHEAHHASPRTPWYELRASMS